MQRSADRGKAETRGELRDRRLTGARGTREEEEGRNGGGDEIVGMETKDNATAVRWKEGSFSWSIGDLLYKHLGSS